MGKLIDGNFTLFGRKKLFVECRSLICEFIRLGL